VPIVRFPAEDNQGVALLRGYLLGRGGGTYLVEDGDELVDRRR
jgi:hypothetical protein